MRHHWNILIASGLAIPLLAACQVADDKAQTSNNADATETATAEPPTPVVVEQVQPAPALPVIATQPGPDGVNVDLNKVAVTGDVLTVQATVKAGVDDGVSLYMSNDEISVIDDATAQRYSLLKDNSGKVLASPVSGDRRIGDYVSRGKTKVFWFKFPAPPATSKTVSINLPNVAPFDGVAVTR